MARKDTLIYKVAAAQSLSSSFNSSPTLIKYLDNCSYQINITTTDSIGSFAVQGSNDYAISEPSNQVSNPGNWVPLTLSGNPTASAANDSIIIDLNQLPFNAIRIAYTSSSAGTGTCDIFINAKQVGG